MSRSSHLMRQIQLQQQQQQQQQQMAENDAAALAAEMFDHFCIATTMRQVLGLYRNMCDAVGLRPSPLNEFYPKLKAKIKNWKAAALWKKFDARASHRVYNKGNSCTGTRVLVIGAGPCGLRTAIEAQLLGAKVVVIEKRDRISRNNVLHLWPFVITDLRNLGAKKFYGKFCAGSIDHISIRQLQCILLKVALLLGVEIHEGVSFENVIEPTDGCGWRAQVTPEDHAVSHYEFDVLIGADGKRNTLEGFKRKEFRGKLAIAITANFINKKTEAEAKVEEISGVAFIFNQSFFKELYQTTGIDLENIVYYKDETHYFVMTAKKHSLIDKGVIIQDFADPAELLSPANVNTDKLLDYAREAAEFSTKYQMPNLEFAVNHYGKPDVAMFDFTSMFAAESSCRVTVRRNYRLLQCLVGDSLLEPFWPTGSGCARGFLSSMDAAYAIKLWSNTKNSILGVLAQRESIYRLLAQTTPENLQRDIGAYTLDPVTRYPNLNKSTVNVWQVKNLLDTDDQVLFEQTHMDTSITQNVICETPLRRKRRSGDTLPLSAILLRWIKAQLHAYEFTQHLNEVSDVFTSGKVLVALINRYRPDLVDLNVVKDWSPKDCNELAFKILENEMGIHRIMSSKESITLDGIDSKIWLNYLEQICEVFRGEIPHVKHPKLDLSEFQTKSTTNRTPDFSNLLQISSNRKGKSPLQDIDMTTNVTHRRSVLDEDRLRKQRKFAAEYNPPAIDTSRRAKKRRSHEKSGNIDRERGIPSALPRGTDEQFTDRIKSMEQRITSRNNYGAEKKPKDLLRAIGKLESNDWNVREIEKKIEQSKKTEAIGKNREKVPKWSKEQFLARQHKMSKPIDRQQSVDEKYKEIDQTIKNLDKQLRGGLEVGERGKNKVASIAGQFIKKDDTSEEKSVPIPKSTSKVGLVFNKQSKTEKCNFCKQTVYLMERISAENLILHRSCLKCHHCHTNLRLGGYAFDRDDPIGKFYCTQHYKLPAKEIRPVVRRSRNQRKNDSEQNQNPSDKNLQTPVRGRPGDVAQLDLLDRGQTPERIEFENIDAMSDGEPSLENVIDENEWTDRNFITGDEDTESDLSNSDSSDDDTESDMFEEANGSPIGAQTLQLANDWIGKQKYSNVIDSDEEDDFYDSSEGLLEDDADSQTDGEEFKKAREMRRQEVKLQPPPENLPTDTETEVQTDTESSSPSNVELNSATEISTDSEFDHDPIVREAPRIFIDDTHIKKPTKVQVKQGIVTSSPTHKLTHNNNNNNNNNMNNGKNQPAPIIIKELPQLEFKPLVQVDPSLLNSNRLPLKNPRAGDYLLNKTPSTEGIASKKSLELKKRYLLGEQGIGNGIMKSGSTSILDSKLKNFNSYISECQKLLNPGADISPSMKSFLDKTKIGDNNSSKICSSNSNNSASNLTVMKNSVNESDKKDSEKENMFVSSRNELNKSATSAAILTTINNSTNVGSNGGGGGGSGSGVGGNSGEYSETVNTALVENISKSVTTQKVKSPILETIDLISPEKSPVPLIDLTKIGIPSEIIKSNQNFIKNIEMEMENDKIIDLTADTPPIKDKLSEKNEKIIIDEKPDVSKDVKEVIPDIITHIENVKNEKHLQHKLSEKNLYSHNEEKEQNQQQKDNDIQETCIEVPNIPWNNKTKNESDMESDSLSSSSTTSSLEDIPHYILDSTTSPDTQNLVGIEQIVPRLEVHDSSGALMQIDSLMIIDGKYVGDPEDIKLLDIPEGTKIDFPISHSEIQKKDEQKKIKEKKQKEEEEGKENEKEEIDVNETDEKLSSSDKESTPTNKPKPIPKFDSATVHQMEEIVNDDKLVIVSTKPNLKFDSKNENKIDTLKNIPLIMEKDDKMKVIKPTTLDLGKSKVINTSTIYSSDKDKTPTAERTVSDSETEVTGQVLTETELSDWTADDAVSENFVDIEFALNSNKGTIKRNKRAKKKSPSPSSKGKIPSSFISIQQQQQKNQQIQQQQQQRKQRENVQTSQTPQTPTKDCGIFRNLDIDEIEFMDTGSEGSYAETYSATNRAMLMNRGYIKFIENNTNDMSDNYRGDKNSHIRSDMNDTMSASGKEVCGVDYIEQGACILSNDYDLKTPVNEIFPTFSSKQQSEVISSSGQQQQSQSQQSSLDVANDIDEDSLQYLTSQGTTDLYTTTTEESEALTVVTSPLESAPKMSLPDNTVTTTSPTSSSDKNDKTTSSTTASSKIPIKKSSSSEREQRRSEERSRQSSKEDLLGMNNNKNKEMDEMSYEEYVRKLQMKITQISNARDSIDVRKQKRKSSKSEMGTVGSIGVSESTQNNNSVIENKNLSIFEPNRSLTTMTVIPSITASSSSISVQQNQKVPEIPTLSRKLEEITKERTKQKDLIHDLVMDKLQSKKQLNAEKRLNRSRNRSIFCPGSMSPSPSKVAISSSGCSNSPHYHIPSSSERRNSKEILDIQQQEQQQQQQLQQQQKENMCSKTKFSPKDNKQIIQMFANSPRLKQRPLSDNLEKATNLIFDQTPKITKTQSFCIYTPRNSPFTQGDKMKIEQFAIDNTSFATPLPPPRANRKYDETLSASREKLRAEARARARLKSNEELGLSPEEKLQMLRRRYHLDMHEITSSSAATTPIASVSPSNLLSIMESSNKSDDNKLRERKMVTSKSVNDITAVQVNLNSDENLNDGESSRELIDFTSDPNLSSQQEKPIKCHRRKDPERRKSLIQTVSSFFNKKKDKDSSPQSPTKEKSSDSVFSRFRISPKSKEKSKDKDLIASGDIQGIISNNNTYSPSVTTKDATYSSSPQLFKRQEDVVSPPPIPPLPTNYQRSDDESYTTESRDQKKQRAISKASRQAELKRLRIAQEIQREQEEIEVKLKELEAKGVLIEKTLRGEDENIENLDSSTIGASDEKLFKELLGIWRNITQLKKRDEELAIQQQELQLEHRHAQLREELDMRLSCSKLDKSSADVAAEGAILNEMLEIVAKRAALRPTETVGTASNTASVSQQQQQLQSNENDDSDI